MYDTISAATIDAMRKNGEVVTIRVITDDRDEGTIVAITEDGKVRTIVPMTEDEMDRVINEKIRALDENVLSLSCYRMAKANGDHRRRWIYVPDGFLFRDECEREHKAVADAFDDDIPF